MNCKECQNYSPKQPKVTRKEVALKFWEYANEYGKGGCLPTLKFFKFFTFGEKLFLDCGETKCGDCIALMTEAINKKRGYQ